MIFNFKTIFRFKKTNPANFFSKKIIHSCLNFIFKKNGKFFIYFGNNFFIFKCHKWNSLKFPRYDTPQYFIRKNHRITFFNIGIYFDVIIKINQKIV